MCKREIKVTMLVCGRPEMRFGPPFICIQSPPSRATNLRSKSFKLVRYEGGESDEEDIFRAKLEGDVKRRGGGS